MFKHGFLRAALALFVMLLAASCGGGGGGGGGGSTPVSPVIATAAEFWGVDGDSMWTLDGSDTTAGTSAVIQYRNRVTVGEPMVIGQRTLVPFRSERPFNDVASVQYRSYDASEGIRAWLDDLPTSASPSYIELPSQIRQGSYRAHEFSEPATGGTLTLTIDVNVVGFEPLSLAGVASTGQALKAIHTFTATFTGGGQSASAATTLTLWYMRGLGVVKQEFVDPNFAAPNNVIREELAGAITPTLSTGVVGDADLLPGLAPTSSELNIGHPGVASDGSGYLVAARSIDASSFAHIEATYVNAQGRVVWSGRVIDNLGTDLSSHASGPIAVNWDGENFWVVARIYQPTVSVGLVRQRVSPTGTLLDGPSGVALASGSWPALASDGTNMLAVYGRNLGSPSFDNALFGTLYARDGTVVVGEQQLAALGSGTPGFASAAFSGGRYLVAFEHGDPRDLSMIRLDRLGQLLDPVPLSLSTAAQSQGSVALAPWAGNFAAVWVDGRNTASMSQPERAIFGSRVGNDGSLLDGDAALGGVVLDASQTSRFGTAAAANAQHGLLVWTAGAYPVAGSAAPGVFGHFLNVGDALDSASEPTSDRHLGSLSSPSAIGRLMAPAAASNGSGFLVVWAETESVQSVRGSVVFPRLVLP